MAFKAYFWFFLTLLVLTHAQVFAGKIAPYDMMDLPFSLMALAGLFGYAYRRRIAHPRFWMIYFFVQIGWDLFYISSKPFALPDSGSLTEFNISLFFSCLLVAPFYMGLYNYAFRSTGLWNQSSPPS
jgi:hypothetical protein